MQIYAVACTLPDDLHYFVFHSHVKQDLAVWDPQDVDHYVALQREVEIAYTDPDKCQVPPRYFAALRPEGVSKEEALQRLIPCLIEADRRSKSVTFLHTHHDSVAELSSVGLGDTPGTLQSVALVRKAREFEPTPELLAALRPPSKALKARDAQGNVLPISEYRTGMTVLDGEQELDLNSLEFRREFGLLNAIRRQRGKKLVRRGQLKLFILPADIRVYLTRDRGGEVLRERHRSWY